jgi:hypothetical protein
VELAKPPWPSKNWTPPPTISQDIGGGITARIEADSHRLKLTLSPTEKKAKQKNGNSLP